MLILAVDSTAKAASVALCEDKHPLSYAFLNTALTHSQTLLPMVDQVLKNAGRTIEDVELLAVTNGPGSFTGVRIGVSLIKGLSFAKNTPCVGVSTLEALANNIAGFEGIYCPVMDARNKQVYNALFEYKDGNLVRLSEDRAISADELRAELEQYGERHVWLIGDGAQLCDGLFCDMNNVSMVNESARWQSAVSVAAAAFDMYNEGKTITADRLDINYLRLSQAEREYNKKRG